MSSDLLPPFISLSSQVDDDPGWTPFQRQVVIAGGGLWEHEELPEPPLIIDYSGPLCNYYNIRVWKDFEGPTGFLGEIAFQHKDPEKHKKWKVRYYFQRQNGVERAFEVIKDSWGGPLVELGGFGPEEILASGTLNLLNGLHDLYCVKCGSDLHGDTEDSSEDSASENAE